MRNAVLFAAGAALWVQPVSAATFLISGTASGTVSGIGACGGSFCPVQTPFVHEFSFIVDEAFDPFKSATVTPLDEDGLYGFSRGISSRGGLYAGTFRDLGFGEFGGVSLHYYRLINPDCSSSNSPCDESASTDSFVVRQLFPAPVPEPATWAMMLFGFGAVGFSLRRRTRQVAVATSL